MSIKEITDKALEKYEKTTGIRAAIQVIPYVGGAIDTLLSKHGSKIQEERLNNYLDKLRIKLEAIEEKISIDPSEELFDFLIQSFDAVIKTRSEEKRHRFAEIFSKQVRHQKEWEEAESAIRFLHELSELHIQILEKALTTHPCDGSFEGLKVITLVEKPHGEDNKFPPQKIAELLPDYSDLAIKMACSELNSRGLLYDEGVGRMGTKAMEYMVATDLAEWFIGWIKNED